MKVQVNCPCCQEVLIVSMENDDINVSSQSDSCSEVEISETLKELNIEFG